MIQRYPNINNFELLIIVPEMLVLIPFTFGSDYLDGCFYYAFSHHNAMVISAPKIENVKEKLRQIKL